MPAHTVLRARFHTLDGNSHHIIVLISKRGRCVRKIATTINCVLLGVIGVLLFFAVRTWTHPKYPREITAGSVLDAPAQPQALPVRNHLYNAAVIQAVVQSNLFRKDRRDYVPPPPPPRPASPVAPPAPQVPPPDLRLTGVMLLPGKPLAFLEGSMSVLKGDRTVAKKPVKRRGYPIGAQIGEYQIARIDKTEAVLDNKRGATLRLKLAKKGRTPIERNGNAFTQKSESFNPRALIPEKKLRKQPAPKPVKTQQARRIPAPRSIRISGAPMPANSEQPIPVGIPRPRISGR